MQVGPSISRMCTVDHDGTPIDVCRWLAQGPHYTLRQLSEHVRRVAGEASMRAEPLSLLEMNAGGGFSCESLWAGAECLNADPTTELVRTLPTLLPAAPAGASQPPVPRRAAQSAMSLALSLTGRQLQLGGAEVGAQARRLPKATSLDARPKPARYTSPSGCALAARPLVREERVGGECPLPLRCRHCACAVRVQRATVGVTASDDQPLYLLKSTVEEAQLTKRVLSTLAGGAAFERSRVEGLRKEFTGMFVTGPDHVWGKCKYREVGKPCPHPVPSRSFRSLPVPSRPYPSLPVTTRPTLPPRSPRSVRVSPFPSQGFCDLPEGSKLEVVSEGVRVRTFDELLADNGIEQLTLLVIKNMYADVDSLHALLASFPFGRVRPALMLFPFHLFNRGAMQKVAKMLHAHNYSLSSHWEVAYWGEMAYAWDNSGCEPPLWSIPTARAARF